MKNLLHIRRAEYGERGISQIELARLAGIQRQRYWLIEREHAEPKPKEIRALARVLRTTPKAIFPSLAADVESQESVR